MIKLFFDIETLPCSDDQLESVLEILKKKRKRSKDGEEVDDLKLHHSTGLEGTFGRIFCIGYIKEDGFISKGVITGSEKEILEQFWQISQDVEVFIGHNILEFDFPFIYKRSIINRVKPRKLYMGKYQSEPIFDTQCEWEKWAYGKAQKLDTLAKVLGLPSSKEDMDGSQVWQAYQDGRFEDISNYCMKDVELVRQVYYKMTFEEMLSDTPVKESLF